MRCVYFLLVPSVPVFARATGSFWRMTAGEHVIRREPLCAGFRHCTGTRPVVRFRQAPPEPARIGVFVARRSGGHEFAYGLVCGAVLETHHESHIEGCRKSLERLDRGAVLAALDP